MSFFETELNKCTQVFPEKKMIGRAMYIPLGENNRLKVEFATNNVRDHYDHLKLSVIDKEQGVIDQCTLHFSDFWGEQEVGGNKVSPYALEYNGKMDWYSYVPMPYEMEQLENQITDYAELFQEQEQSMAMQQFM